MDNLHFDFWSTITLAIFAFLATIMGVYYTRNSYLITLKGFEKNKTRSEKAKLYYDNYINKPPSFKPSGFLKKLDSDELNESVILPTEFTDFLIKNHPNNYFQYCARLKKSHKYFKIDNLSNKEVLIPKIKYIYLRQFGYFLLYILFATLATFLFLYNNQIINSFDDNNFWGILYLLLIGIILFLSLMFISLFEATQLSNVRYLIKELADNDSNT